MQNVNLLIGIPTTGFIQWQFAQSMMSLETPPGSKVVWVPRVMIDTSRNLLADKVITDPQVTHLLMIDDDHVFDYDIVNRLLQRDVDIIGALAFKRRADYSPCVYKKDENGDHHQFLPETFMEVDAIGSGCILIKRQVIEDIQFPWFETYYDKNGLHWSVDFDFCVKAKKEGFKIWCDPQITIKHLGDQPEIGIENFQEYILKNKSEWKFKEK